MTIIDPKFGEEMKRFREAKGISQRRLGSLVGLDSGYISRIERAEFKPPSEQKIVAIANAIGADPDYMLSLAGKLSSDVASVVQEQPREMSDAVRNLGRAGTRATLAVGIGLLAAAFLTADSDEDRKAKIKELFDKIREEADSLTPEEQFEVIDDIKLSLVDWQMDLGS